MIESQKYLKRSFGETDAGQSLTASNALEVRTGAIKDALDELESWVEQLDVEIEGLFSDLAQILREDIEKSANREPEKAPRSSPVPLANRIFKSADSLDNIVHTIHRLREKISI